MAANLLLDDIRKHIDKKKHVGAKASKPTVNHEEKQNWSDAFLNEKETIKKHRQ
jgi:hypothetical protein